MSLRYRHRQTDRNFLFMCVPIAAVIVGTWAWLTRDATASTVILVALLALLAIVMIVLSRLTIEVTDQELSISFGLGAFRRRWPLADILRVERTELAWWSGPGIGSQTTTYLVRSGPAVMIELKDGRFVRIGSDDVEGLMGALGRRPEA